MINLDDRVKEIALDLVHQKSIVETEDEIKVSDKVYEIMSQMKYFKANPDNLYFLNCKNDAWNRKIVIAIVNGEKAPTDKTVVFIGHTDTVGISDYGTLAEYATKPEELVEKLKQVSGLTDEVKEDLESGKYLFGRGIFDMKSGDANVIALMEMVSDDVENFEGNIIYAAVCDEEGNSTGMLNFVPELIRLKKEKGYDYQAVLDPDYIAPAYPGDKNIYQYIGTVGKLMPSFFVVGKETHVGESFSGLDPNQIVAEITREVNLNPKYSDVVEGEVTLPPITLKQRDLKPEYSVQIAKTATLFFNYATHSSTPDQVVDKMVGAASMCFQNVIDTLNERYKKFCEMQGLDYQVLPWKERVIDYAKFYELVKAEVGDKLDDMVSEFTNEIKQNKNYDSREQTMKVVEYVHSLWSDKNPIVIVYLTPPYYPHIYVDDKTPKNKALVDAVNHAVTTTNTDYSLVQKKFLPCISDLSYASAPKEAGAVEALKNNTPGYGVIYDLPIDEMRELDLPVADIGCYGKDAHQFTERVEVGYSYGVLPEILYKTMMSLLGQEK